MKNLFQIGQLVLFHRVNHFGMYKVCDIVNADIKPMYMIENSESEVLIFAFERELTTIFN